MQRQHRALLPTGFKLDDLDSGHLAGLDMSGFVHVSVSAGPDSLNEFEVILRVSPADIRHGRRHLSFSNDFSRHLLFLSLGHSLENPHGLTALRLSLPFARDSFLLENSCLNC